VVIDYKSGAGGNLGASDVARSAPDGYTWMLAPETLLTINPLKEAMAANGVRSEGTTQEAAQKELQRLAKRWEAVARKIDLNVD
jgi:tripartite-type tricarboxylate transporter receptor subunit TctC